MTHKSQTRKDKGKEKASTLQNPIVAPSALMPASIDEEHFDFTNLNISDDDSEDEPKAPQSGHSSQIQTQNTNLGVNDPSLQPPSSKAAADVHHFFEKSEGKMVCKLCRYIVFMHSCMQLVSDMASETARRMSQTSTINTQ